jgi:hypothetical protein
MVLGKLVCATMIKRVGGKFMKRNTLFRGKRKFLVGVSNFIHYYINYLVVKRQESSIVMIKFCAKWLIKKWEMEKMPV